MPPHVASDRIATSDCSQYEITCHVLSAMRFLTRPMESTEARGIGAIGGQAGKMKPDAGRSNTRSSSVTSQIERGFAATAVSYRKSMHIYGVILAGNT